MSSRVASLRVWFMVIAAVILVAAGAYFATRSPGVDDEQELGAPQTELPIPAPPPAPTSTLVSRHEDELSAPVRTILYSCAADTFFLARVEVESLTGRAEVFLSDGTKMLLTQVPSATGTTYANSGRSFEYWSSGDSAFIEEEDVQSYANCTVRWVLEPRA